MAHIYQCVVHEPNSIYLQPYHFKKPPNKVTEGNKCFWSKDVELGGSICKKCYWKYEHRQKSEKESIDILPKDVNVCIWLYLFVFRCSSLLKSKTQIQIIPQL